MPTVGKVIEGLRLLLLALDTGVAAGQLRSDDPLDWSQVRITETPEQALERVRREQGQG